MKKITTVISGAVFLLFAAISQAALIIDVENVNGGINNNPWYYPFAWDSSENWTHVLGETGEEEFLGNANSGTLTIDVRSGDAWELSTVIVGVIDFQDGAIIWAPNNDFVGSLGSNSIAGLNNTGMLDVTVASIVPSARYGIASSTLEVVTADVPEPSTLLLMSLGLLGIGATRLRKLKA